MYLTSEINCENQNQEHVSKICLLLLELTSPCSLLDNQKIGYLGALKTRMTFHIWTTSTPMRKTQLAFGGTNITACYIISPFSNKVVQRFVLINNIQIATCCSIFSKPQHSLLKSWSYLVLERICSVAVCGEKSKNEELCNTFLALCGATLFFFFYFL